MLMKLPAVFFGFMVSFSCCFSQTKLQAKLEKSLPSKRDTALVNTLNQLCWEYRRTDTQKAIHFGERASKLSRELRYWKGLAYSFKNLGAIYSIGGKYSKAKVYLNQALQQFSELRNETETGNIYNLYGLLYWETGKYDSALVNYDAALRYYKSAHDLEGITIVYSNSGIIYYETGKLDKALSRYAKALDIAEQRNDRRTLASIHTNIGLVYKQLGDYPKALYHQKLSIGFEQENLSGIAKSYTNIGVTYYQMQNPDSSMFYHQKALKIYGQIGEMKGISQSLVNIGSIYHDQGNFVKANVNYTNALLMKRRMQDPLGETIVLTHLGHLRMDQGKTNEAIAYLDTAYRQAHHIRSLRYQVETSKMLAELYEKAGNSDKAMLYYKIYTAANDNYLREQSNHKLTGVLVDIATKGKQQKISTLEKKVDKVTGQKGWMAMIAIFILVIAAFVVLLLRHRHRKNQLQFQIKLEENTVALMEFTQQMITKNAELAVLREQLENTNEETVFLSKEELVSAPEQTALSPERVETLNQLSAARIVTDEDWEAFKQLYTRVHPRFMLRMKELYASITQAELRLAALITLQLSSKEIATILGISAESVKKARQRLRRKMELSPEQELDEVLSQIN